MYFCYRVTSKAEERPCGSGRGFRSNCLFWVASSKETPARSSSWPSSCSPRFASAWNQPKYTRESTNCGFKVRCMRLEIIQLSSFDRKSMSIDCVPSQNRKSISDKHIVAHCASRWIPMQRGGARAPGGHVCASRFRLTGRVLHARDYTAHRATLGPLYDEHGEFKFSKHIFWYIQVSGLFRVSYF